MSREARSVVVMFALLLAAASQANAQASTGKEWEPGGRMRAYMGGLLGPGALLGVALGGTVDHLREDPEEWDQDANGFAKRIASSAGRHAVQETVRHGLAAVMSASTSYQACSCDAFGKRVGNAFIETVTVRKRDGDRLLAIPRFAGSYAGALAEQTWRPGRSTPEVLSTAASSVAFGFVSNLWREFVGWPK